MSQQVEKEKQPLYRKGQLVRVVDYYADQIVRGYYLALVTGVRSFNFSYTSVTGHSLHFIYDLLPLNDSPYNKYRNVAEEYQMTPVGEE